MEMKKGGEKTVAAVMHAHAHARQHVRCRPKEYELEMVTLRYFIHQLRAYCLITGSRK